MRFAYGTEYGSVMIVAGLTATMSGALGYCKLLKLVASFSGILFEVVTAEHVLAENR